MRRFSLIILLAAFVLVGIEKFSTTTATAAPETRAWKEYIGERMSLPLIKRVGAEVTPKLRENTSTAGTFKYGSHFAAAGKPDFIVVGKFNDRIVAVYVIKGHVDGFDFMQFD